MEERPSEQTRPTVETGQSDDVQRQPAYNEQTDTTEGMVPPGMPIPTPDSETERENTPEGIAVPMGGTLPVDHTGYPAVPRYSTASPNIDNLQELEIEEIAEEENPTAQPVQDKEVTNDLLSNPPKRKQVKREFKAHVQNIKDEYKRRLKLAREEYEQAIQFSVVPKAGDARGKKKNGKKK